MKMWAVFDKDKILHAAAGFAIFWLIVMINLTLAMLAVIVAAYCKEAYDYLHQESHTPDKHDAFATLAGGLLALILWGIL